MNEDTRRAIVAEIVAATRVRTKQPWQFDVDDYLAQCSSVSRQRAYDILMNRVRSGELRSELVSYNGKQVRVFWRERDAPPTE